MTCQTAVCMVVVYVNVGHVLFNRTMRQDYFSGVASAVGCAVMKRD